MNYYQDITLLPDTDIAVGFLWQKVYQQVHIALVENKIADNQSAIAVAFPEYGNGGFPLGNKLRLFAPDQERLEQLDIQKWLNRLTDYVHIKSIKQIDSDKITGYVSFIRQHIKGANRIKKDMETYAEWEANKTGKTVEYCLKELKKSQPKADSKTPFLWLESQKTKQRFHLFIERVEAKNPVSGNFTCYGLSWSNKDKSQIATVPNF